MAKALAVGGALLLASWASPAGAAELSANGPRECADASELSFRVERSIGVPLAHAAPLAFDVAIKRNASGYVARIVVAGSAPQAARFTRELRAADCDKLVDAVSVAVALALGMAEPSGAQATASTDRVVPPPEVPATSAAAMPHTAPPTDATDDGDEAADSGDEASSAGKNAAPLPSISLWLLGDAGSLASPSVGAAVGVELGWSHLELRALGTLLFEQATQLDSPTQPAPGAKLQLMTGGVLACAAPFESLHASFAPFACLGAELGQLSGVGTGVASPRRGSTLWVAPLLQAGASWRVPDTALRLALALIGAAPLTRDEFALRGIGSVHQPPSIVGRLSLGVSVGFD